MSDSLKEQLLKLGFKPPASRKNDQAHKSRDRKPAASQGRKSAKPKGGAQQPRSRSQQDIDLAKAYAIRAQKEKDERIAAEKQRQEEARLRRESRARLSELLTRVRLNDEKAEIARHFEYGGKIRRVHVTEAQLKALNAGELAVVQMAGRYHVLTPADAQEAERIMPGSLALQVDPNAAPADEDYSDSKFQVPDDLVW